MMMREAMRSAYAWRIMRTALRGPDAKRYARTDGRTDGELKPLRSASFRVRNAHTRISTFIGFG